MLHHKALEIIEASSNLQLHMTCIECAMDLAEVLHQYNSEDQDFKVIQLLGARTFNAFGASLKLALSGYSQNSVLIMRDILETVFLLSLFRGDRSLITQWRTADKKTQRKQFSPAKVRIALDKRDRFVSKKRAELYGIFSELAAHPNMKSGLMMKPEKNGGIAIGAFIEKTTLEATLSEMGRLAIQVGENLDLFFPDNWQDGLPSRRQFAATKESWIDTFYR